MENSERDGNILSPSLSPGVCLNSCPLSQLYHPTIGRPLLLLPAIFSSIRVFSNELALHMRCPKYWTFLAPVSSSPHCLWPLLQSSAQWDPAGHPSVGFTPAPRENSICSFEKLWELLLMHTQALLRNPPSGHPLDHSLHP